MFPIKLGLCNVLDICKWDKTYAVSIGITWLLSSTSTTFDKTSQPLIFNDVISILVKDLNLYLRILY